VTETGSKVLITPPIIKSQKEAEMVEEVEELKESQKEELFEEEQLPSLEEEKERLLDEVKRIKHDAEEEAKKITEEADQAAFKVMQKNSVDARKIKEEAQSEAQSIVEDAARTAEEKVREAELKAAAIIEESKSKAYDEGKTEGFKKGEEEVERLIERLHVIINAAIDKRKVIVENTERQLVDLVMLIARKVVKVISEAERKVVLENIKEALKKVRSETEITIRVNTVDLELTTKNKKRFISLMENLEHITVEEDNRVDPGGCIIETSFGDIDARISTQLSVLEEKIRELVPIKE
jgi:flagellar assembly protein FliH